MNIISFRRLSSAILSLSSSTNIKIVDGQHGIVYSISGRQADYKKNYRIELSDCPQEDLVFFSNSSYSLVLFRDKPSEELVKLIEGEEKFAGIVGYSHVLSYLDMIEIPFLALQGLVHSFEALPNCAPSFQNKVWAGLISSKVVGWTTGEDGFQKGRPIFAENEVDGVPSEKIVLLADGKIETFKELSVWKQGILNAISCDEAKSRAMKFLLHLPENANENCDCLVKQSEEGLSELLLTEAEALYLVEKVDPEALPESWTSWIYAETPTNLFSEAWDKKYPGFAIARKEKKNALSS